MFDYSGFCFDFVGGNFAFHVFRDYGFAEFFVDFGWGCWEVLKFWKI
jgi:hypothetical protein